MNDNETESDVASCAHGGWGPTKIELNEHTLDAWRAFHRVSEGSLVHVDFSDEDHVQVTDAHSK